MALLKPPTKRSCVYGTENSNSKNEDEPEEEKNLCDDTVTSDFTSDSSSTCGSSSSRASCSKQSKSFNMDWLKRRKNWLTYEKDMGMFCLLCQKYDKHPYDQEKILGIRLLVQAANC